MTFILNTSVKTNELGRLAFDYPYVVYRTLYQFSQTKHINHQIGAKLQGHDRVIIYCKHSCLKMKSEDRELLRQLVSNTSVNSVYDACEVLMYQSELNRLYGTESIDGDASHETFWTKLKRMFN